jgi:hypothetical protein
MSGSARDEDTDMLDTRSRQRRIGMLARRIVMLASGIVAAALGASNVGSPVASAHEGPPFPILMDQPVAEYSISVWADPDIGDALFYIVVESPQGKRPQSVPSVALWVEPVSGRLERVTYDARQMSLKSQLQFEVKPYFDVGDMWTVGIQVTAPGGGSGEITAEVESTPPGYGLWDFALYLFPFVLLGGLWVFAMIRRRRRTWAEHVQHDSADGDEPTDSSTDGNESDSDSDSDANGHAADHEPLEIRSSRRS